MKGKWGLQQDDEELFLWNQTNLNPNLTAATGFLCDFGKIN